MRTGVASGRPLQGDVETCPLPELMSFFSISWLRPVCLFADSRRPRSCYAELSVLSAANRLQPSQAFLIDSSRVIQAVPYGLGGSQIAFGAG